MLFPTQVLDPAEKGSQENREKLLLYEKILLITKLLGNLHLPTYWTNKSPFASN